ncbi:molybdopterin-binding protein [Ferrimonas pelagia]|uniref:Molybdopterin-binding protein n=1 Tax=Ferrimonas pelagia TaxID=1177826 RepID=A0ABP9EYH1_9GAMM
MKISARNVLKGKVVAVEMGAVNAEVLIEVAPGIEVASIITKAAFEKLELAVGKEAYAVLKASNVMVAVD